MIRRCYTQIVPTLLILFFSQISANSEPAPISQVYQRYVQESITRDRSELTQDFYTFWEAQFEAALDANQTDSFTYFRMLDELGAIQKKIGKRDEALGTYREMADRAHSSNQPDQEITALNNLWAANVPLAEKENIAQNLLASYRNLLSMSGGGNLDEIIGSYGDALYEVGLFYLNNAKRISRETPSSDDKNNPSQAAYGKAIEYLQSSLDLPHDGRYSNTSIKFDLGRAYLNSGHSEDAHRLFNDLLESDQTEYSKLWIGHLNILSSTEKDSPSYQQEIRGLLDSLSDSDDDYRLPLLQELGLSYRRTGQELEASKIFKELVGKDESDNVNAYNLFELAKSYMAIGKVQLANDLMNEILRQYPETGSAKIAEEYFKNQKETIENAIRPIADDLFNNELTIVPSQEKLLNVETAADITPSPEKNEALSLSTVSKTFKPWIYVLFTIIGCGVLLLWFMKKRHMR